VRVTEIVVRELEKTKPDKWDTCKLASFEKKFKLGTRKY
jgi:hypothetical protein